MPGNMDQHGKCKNRVAWISGVTDKIDSTVSVVPGSMDQRTDVPLENQSKGFNLHFLKSQSC